MAGDHSELPREKILAEAMQLVADEGAEQITIRNLARRLGFAPATLYTYFRSKDELLQQVALQGFEQLVDVTREATEHADVRRAMSEGGRRYLEFAVKNPALYKLMFDEIDFRGFRGDPSVFAPARALFDLYRDLYARAVEAGVIRRVDPEVQTVISWSASHGFAMLALSGRLPPPRMQKTPLETIQEAFLEFLADALRP